MIANSLQFVDQSVGLWLKRWEIINKQFDMFDKITTYLIKMNLK